MFVVQTPDHFHDFVVSSFSQAEGRLTLTCKGCDSKFGKGRRWTEVTSKWTRNFFVTRGTGEVVAVRSRTQGWRAALLSRFEGLFAQAQAHQG